MHWFKKVISALTVSGLSVGLCLAEGNPCWTDISEASGKLCLGVSSNILSEKVLLGHTVFDKEGRLECRYEFPGEGTDSIQLSKFLSLDATIENTAELLSGDSIQNAKHFTQNFQACDGVAEKGREVIEHISELSTENQNSIGIRFPIVQGTREISSIEIAVFNPDGSRQVIASIGGGSDEHVSKHENIEEICEDFYEGCAWPLLKGKKTNYKERNKETAKIKGREAAKKQKLPYYAYDKSGHWYVGDTIDRADCEDGDNSLYRLECRPVLKNN